MLLKNVSVDGGKYKTKGKYLTVEQGLISKVEAYEEGTIIGDGTHVVIFNGEEYLVGEDATPRDYDINKDNDFHKLLIYVMVAKLTEVGDKVLLTAGMPLSLFRDRNKREEAEASLVGKVELIIDGEFNSFEIVKATILPESLGAVYRSPIYYKTRLVGVIDIGGLNTNGAIYDKCKPVRESIFTMNQGGLILQSKIKSELNSKLGLNYQEYEIPNVMKNGIFKGGAPYGAGNEIVSNVICKHLEEILDEAKRKNWNIDGLEEIIFIGGTSDSITKYIEDKFNNATVSESAEWDNVRAFNTVGGVLCQKARAR